MSGIPDEVVEAAAAATGIFRDEVARGLTAALAVRDDHGIPVLLTVLLADLIEQVGWSCGSHGWQPVYRIKDTNNNKGATL
jgi:hypothetical protein